MFNRGQISGSMMRHSSGKDVRKFFEENLVIGNSLRDESGVKMIV